MLNNSFSKNIYALEQNNNINSNQSTLPSSSINLGRTVGLDVSEFLNSKKDDTPRSGTAGQRWPTEPYSKVGDGSDELRKWMEKPADWESGSKALIVRPGNTEWPNQRPCSFNILVTGPEGCGKTAFTQAFIANYKASKWTALQVRVIDTKGFRLQDWREWYRSIRALLHEKFQQYQRQQEEMQANKQLFLQQDKIYKDNRIHLCIFLMSGRQPELELLILSKLAKKANTLPIFVASSRISKHEASAAQAFILAQIKHQRIEVYELKEQQRALQCSEAWLRPHSAEMRMLYYGILSHSQSLVYLTAYYLHKYRERKAQRKPRNKFLRRVVKNLSQILQF